MGEKKINSIDIGLGVVGSGLALGMAYPGVISTLAIPTFISTPVVLCGVGAIGGAYGIYKVVTKDKRDSKVIFKKNCEAWELFWKDNKIVKNDLCPKFAYDITDGLKRTIMFELPFGVYKSDVENSSTRLKEMLQVDNIKINTKDNKLYLNISTLSQEQKDWNEFWSMSDIKSRGGEYPELLDIENKPYGKIYKFKSPIGLSTHHLNKIDIVIKEFVGYEDVTFKIKDGCLYIEVITSDIPTNVPFNVVNDNCDDINVILGKNQKMEDIVISLNKVHSYLIVGATGGGKSVCIHNILSQLYTKYTSPKEMLFYIADLKRVECINYKDIVNTVKYTDNIRDAASMVDELLNICEERHELFTDTAKGIKNLAQYNKHVSEDKKLPYIVFVIEECARLMSDNNIQKKIAELAFICRSAGIILLLTIQKPTKSLFSPDIRASMLASICFKTTTAKNSEIICGDGRLKNLRGKGDCWIITDDLSVGEQRIQGAYLDPEDIDEYLNKHCKFK